MADKKINNLLRFNKNQKWLCFDAETEDLNLFSTRPWQLSWITFCGDKILTQQDRFVWFPDLKVSKGAAQITRFDFDSYKAKAEDPKKVLEDFDRILYNPNYLITGANIIGFDINVLANLRRLLGKKKDFSYLNRMHDIQNIEKSIQIDYTTPQEDPIEWNFKLYNLRKKGLKTSVEYLCKKYGIPYDKNKAHDGLYDVLRSKEILQKQLHQINL